MFRNFLNENNGKFLLSNQLYDLQSRVCVRVYVHVCVDETEIRHSQIRRAEFYIRIHTPNKTNFFCYLFSNLFFYCNEKYLSSAHRAGTISTGKGTTRYINKINCSNKMSKFSIWYCAGYNLFYSDLDEKIPNWFASTCV